MCARNLKAKNLMKASAGSRMKKILILIEDGSLLFDNRVKREAVTLTKAGYDVHVICPKYPGEKTSDTYKGIHVYRYSKWKWGGHFSEYMSSLLKGGWLALRISRRNCGFDYIQACNPPDLWFIIALFFKFFSNTKFVFDHHDVCPELFISRFGGSRKNLVYRIMLLLERLTFMISDGVISTNESYKQIAIRRGGVPEKNIRVVRNGPDLAKFKPMPVDPAVKNKDNIVVGYLGNMNPQDGVDYLLKTAKRIIIDRNRKEFHFVLIGNGDVFKELKEMSRKDGLDHYVTFTGRIPDDDMLKYLSSCDLCVQPDPKNLLNNISTMNKLMEYMALGKPVVAFDLIETRYSGGECVLYAAPNDINDMADKIVALADDTKLMSEMGKQGRERIEQTLAWEHSESQLIDLYQNV